MLGRYIGLPRPNGKHNYNRTAISRGIALMRRLGERVSLFVPGVANPDGSHWINWASLAPTTGTQVLGSELVTNSGPSFTGTTGWANYQSTIAASGGSIICTFTSTDGGLQQGINLIPGATYRLTGGYRNISATGVKVMVQRGQAGGYATQASTPLVATTTQSVFSVDFVATGVDNEVGVRTTGTAIGQQVALDFISLKQVITMPQAPWLMDYVESTMNTAAVVDGPVGALTDGSATVGPELAPATTSTTGWAANSATLSVDSGRLKCVMTGTGDNGAYFDIATTVGQAVFISARVSNSSQAALASFRIATGAWTLLSQSADVPVGQSRVLTLYGVATSTTTRIAFDRRAASAVVGDTIYVDQVSARALTGRHATQGTGANKPVLRRGAVNRVLQSATLGTGWSSNVSGAASSNTAAGLDGATLDASTVICTAAVNSGVYAAGTGIAVGAPTTMFGIVRRVSGTATRAMLGGDTTNLWLKFNPQTMAIHSVGSGVTASSVQPLTGGFFLFVWSGAPTLVNGSYVVYNDDGAGAVSLAVANTGAVDGIFTAAQLLDFGVAKTTTVPASSARGNYALEFDGSDDSLALGSIPFTMADDHAVIAGARRDTPTGPYTAIFGSGGTGAQKICHLGVTNAGMPYAQWQDDAAVNAGMISTTPRIGIPFVLSGRKVGNTQSARVNGASIGSSAVTFGATAVGLPKLGTVVNTGGEFLRGAIYCVVVVRGPITDAELLTLERFVAALTGPTGINF